MQYDPIQGQGQGHQPFKGGNPAVFKRYLLRHLQRELATDHEVEIFQNMRTVKLLKFCYDCFIVKPIDTLCSNVVKFGRREIGEIVRCLLDKKKTKFRLALQLSLLRGSHPKSAPTMYSKSAPGGRFNPNPFTLG